MIANWFCFFEHTLIQDWAIHFPKGLHEKLEHTGTAPQFQFLMWPPGKINVPTLP